MEDVPFRIYHYNIVSTICSIIQQASRVYIPCLFHRRHFFSLPDSSSESGGPQSLEHIRLVLLAKKEIFVDSRLLSFDLTAGRQKVANTLYLLYNF